MNRDEDKGNIKTPFFDVWYGKGVYVAVYR